MITMLRRLFWLAVLGGAGYAGWTFWQRRQAPGPPAAEPPATAPRAERWLPPTDQGCPDGYPIKANDNSGIYHVPGGRFYERTAPERCYARAADAEADGYRAAKA
ncbi:MAG TPA: hypothetical protein VIS05_08055 [Ilumatobacter sp.]